MSLSLKLFYVEQFENRGACTECVCLRNLLQMFYVEQS
jgi:hypothetical protein